MSIVNTIFLSSNGFFSSFSFRFFDKTAFSPFNLCESLTFIDFMADHFGIITYILMCGAAATSAINFKFILFCAQLRCARFDILEK